MADRYQDRAFPADDDRGSRHAAGKDESDPLAELARLIGQTDPSSNFGRANQPMPPVESAQREQPEEAPDAGQASAGPRRWMQRAVREEAPPPQEDFFTHSVHPLRRYTSPPASEPQHHEAPSFAEPDEPDPARYDPAL